jgi:DNA-binding transcriptional ArsR family regulator
MEAKSEPGAVATGFRPGEPEDLVMRRNLALKNTEVPARALRIEKAAETVSGELDKVIHERMRLGIISALAANEKVSFTDLKKLLNTTDGNISVHARKLEDAGYVTCEKSFRGRTPLTEYAITKDGKKALERYLNHMEALIRAMKNV